MGQAFACSPGRRAGHVHDLLTLLQGARGSLSQDLVALWVDEYGPALSFMRRVFPPGLMRYLNVKKPTAPAALLVNASQAHQVSLTSQQDRQTTKSPLYPFQRKGQ